MNGTPEQQQKGTQPKSSNTGMYIAIALVVIVVLGYGAMKVVKGMFSYGVQKAIEAGTGVSVDQSGGTITFKGQDGSSIVMTGKDGEGSISVKGKDGKGEMNFNSGANATIPADFPKDFPVIAGAEVATVSRVADTNETGFSVVWLTKKTPKQCADFYTKAFGEKGWKITASTEADSVYSQIFEGAPNKSGKKYAGTVITEQVEKDTHVTLIISVPLN